MSFISSSIVNGDVRECSVVVVSFVSSLLCHRYSLCGSHGECSVLMLSL